MASSAGVRWLMVGFLKDEWSERSLIFEDLRTRLNDFLVL